MPLDAQPEDLRSTLLRQLDPATRHAAAAIVGAAERGVYAVGGAVRDVLLGRPVSDVDLATEDDAITVARAALPGARITEHSRFRTATLKFGTARLDIATARTETYASPGALPRVSMPATIEQDLRRRDFTVNAMALRLDGEAALIDPYSGREDLRAGMIRVLHDASFVDDPTRIYRAFRYAARLGLEVEQHTRALVADALRRVSAVGGERLRRELELLTLDLPPGVAIQGCDAAGALAAIDPCLGWTSHCTSALADEELRRLAGSGDGAAHALGFALLTAAASRDDAARAAARLRLKRGEASAVAAYAALRDAAHLLARPGAKPSGVVVLLDRYPAVAIAAFAGLHADEIAGRLALRYLAEWRHVKPALTGAELQRLGVPAGPQVQRGLQLLRAAQLDGTAPDPGAARELALRFAHSIRDAGAMAAPVDLRTNGH